MPNHSRIAAILVALSAWAGLCLQFYDSMQQLHNPLSALWAMALYFTIFTNFVVAVAFTLTAFEHYLHPRMLGGVLLAIVLVGAVYHLLLSNVPILGGPAALIANVYFHTVTPVLVVLFWIFFAPKGYLQWIDAVSWAAYPLTYLGYALIRGHYTQIYPYPFINVVQIGMAASLRNSAFITLGFFLVSFALIAIDRRTKQAA